MDADDITDDSREDVVVDDPEGDETPDEDEDSRDDQPQSGLERELATSYSVPGAFLTALSHAVLAVLRLTFNRSRSFFSNPKLLCALKCPTHPSV